MVPGIPAAGRQQSGHDCRHRHEQNEETQDLGTRLPTMSQRVEQQSRRPACAEQPLRRLARNSCFTDELGRHGFVLVQRHC